MAYVRIIDTFARFHVDVEPVGTDDVPVFVVCDVEIGDVVRVFGSGQSYFGDELLVRYDGLVRVGVVRVRVVGTFGTFLDDGNGCRVSACGERDFGCASIVAVVCREGRDGDCVASAVAGVGSDGEPVALYACGPRGGRGERDGFLKAGFSAECQDFVLFPECDFHVLFLEGFAPGQKQCRQSEYRSRVADVFHSLKLVNCPCSIEYVLPAVRCAEWAGSTR